MDKENESERMRFAVVGSFVHCCKCPDFAKLDGDEEEGKAMFHEDDSFFQVLSDHAVVVNQQGEIEWFGPSQDPAFASFSVDSVLTLTETQLVCPGFVDTHIHAPQYSYTGTAIDQPLMEWLNRYTFPAEAKLGRDIDLAHSVFEKVVKRTLSFGTTTALYFATKDIEPCKVLVDVCATLGQRGLIGKVCMDRNSPDFYCESVEEGLEDTEAFINHVRNTPAGKRGLVLPVITPRFIPTCSPDLLEGLGCLAKKYDCHVQSHISESLQEVNFSAQLHPGEGTDAEIFDRFGLLTDKTVMAHGVHLTDDDVLLMKDRGAALSHCPLSNFYFADGHFPTARVLRMGAKVGLGTDVAGGYSPSMLNAQRMAVVASLSGALEHRKELVRDHGLNYKRAFYLATLGSARALGLDHKIGSFAPAKAFDALILDAGVGNFDLFPGETSLDFFQKICTLGDDRNIRTVFVQGKQVCSK